MELSTILLGLAVLACPITMGVMMWMMNKNMNGQHGHPQAHKTGAHRLATLLEQRRHLEQEIAEAERMAAQITASATSTDLTWAPASPRTTASGASRKNS